MKFDVKCAISLALIGLTTLPSLGQDLPQSRSQYHQNPLLVNPAFAADGNAELVLSSRQIIGDKSSPATSILTGKGTIGEKSQMGIGGKLYYDKNGPFRQYGFGLTYAYKLLLNETKDLSLSFGLQGGLVAYALDRSSINIKGDRLINSIENKVVPTADFGSVLQSPKFFFSIALLNMYARNFKDASESFNDNTATTNFLVYSAYKFSINEIKIEPLVLLLLRSNSETLNNFFDTGFKVYSKKFLAGISYRYLQSISLITSYRYNKISIGIAYDIPLNYELMRGYSEIVLKYHFN